MRPILIFAPSIGFRIFCGSAVLCALIFGSSEAFAQSATGVPANTATARSLTDATDQIQKDLIDREVLGLSSSGGVAVGIGVSPSGRLRTSAHDGLKDNLGGKTFSFDADEASAFANVVAGVPGTTLGGQVKFSGFVGYNSLSLDIKSNHVKILDPNQFGGARNESFVAGGTALWASQNTYALATIVGAWGETTLIDSVDDCSPKGCNLHRYKFGTTALIANATAGHVFDLSEGASGPKLDLRGSIGYTQTDGDRFKNINGDEQVYAFSTWTGVGAVTLFTNLALGNAALLRPYIQGYVRQEWDYNNEFSAQENQGPFLGTFTLDQSHTYLGVDAGLTYAIDNMTFGGSIYVEGSADEETLGGRVSASWKFN